MPFAKPEHFELLSAATSASCSGRTTRLSIRPVRVYCTVQQRVVHSKSMCRDRIYCTAHLLMCEDVPRDASSDASPVVAPRGSRVHVELPAARESAAHTTRSSARRARPGLRAGGLRGPVSRSAPDVYRLMLDDELNDAPVSSLAWKPGAPAASLSLRCSAFRLDLNCS